MGFSFHLTVLFVINTSKGTFVCTGYYGMDTVVRIDTFTYKNHFSLIILDYERPCMGQ